MTDKSEPSSSGNTSNIVSNFDLRALLGQRLRDLFNEPPAPLPSRLAELLEQLAARDKSHPLVSDTLRDGILALAPNLRAFAFSLSGNHDVADDLVQETLLKAWGHLDSFQEGTNLRAWLFTILRNTFFSEMRKRRREIEDKDGEKAATLTVAPAQQGHVDVEDMRNALERLPAEQREALVLVGAAGMTYEEAAEVAQCAVGTIKSRVNRARIRLGELLGVSGGGEFGADQIGPT